MNRRQFFPPSIGIIMVMLLIIACGAPQATPQPVPATSTPMPMPSESPPVVLPTSIPTRIPPTRTLPPPTLTPTPEIVAQHIVDLVEQGLITIGVTGISIDSVALHVQSNTDEQLRINTPAGTYFVSAVSGSQNMVVRRSFTLLLLPHEELDYTVDAACANIHLDQPGEEVNFAVLRASDQPELTQLLVVLETAEVDYEIEQAAIWIVTDNANYDDLGILVSGFGYGSRVIDEQDTLHAMQLVDQAGIDITTHAVWADLDTLIPAITDPALVDWLRQRGVNVVVPPTPGPGAGEIGLYATGATASTQYSDPSWSAMQATGAPDTFECGDIRYAWASSTSSGVDWLLLTYDTPILPTRIVIYQTYNPSAVTLVEVADQAGNYYTVYDADPVVVSRCPYQMEIIVRGVNVPVDTIRITINQSINPGWNEIDAVQLIGLPEN